jgi:hypothetical protein
MIRITMYAYDDAAGTVVFETVAAHGHDLATAIDQAITLLADRRPQLPAAPVEHAPHEHEVPAADPHAPTTAPVESEPDQEGNHGSQGP